MWQGRVHSQEQERQLTRSVLNGLGKDFVGKAQGFGKGQCQRVLEKTISPQVGAGKRSDFGKDQCQQVFESAVFPRWEQERKVIWEKIKANGSWKRLGKGMVRMLRAMGCSFECRYIPVALERALAWLHSLALANLWNVALEESKPK